VHAEDNPFVPEIIRHMNAVVDAMRPAVPFTVQRTEFVASGDGVQKSVDLIGVELHRCGMTTPQRPAGVPLPGGQGWIEQRCPEAKQASPP